MKEILFNYKGLLAAYKIDRNTLQDQWEDFLIVNALDRSVAKLVS